MAAKKGGGGPALAVRYTPTAEERERVFLARLERAGAVYARVARLFPALIVAVAAVALALVLASFVGARGERLGAGMAVIVLLVSVPAAVMAVPRLRRRLVFGAGGEETLAAGRYGVAWTPASGAPVRLGWEEMEAVEERAGVLLFVPRRGVALAIPRRAVDERAAARLREIARGALGERARF